MTPGLGRRLLPALGGLLALYLAVPIAAFVVRVSRSGGSPFQVPGLVPAAIVSIVTATISLGIICLFGIPLAYVLARSKSRLAGLVAVCTQLPLALPPVMCGILLVYLVGPYTALGRLFNGRLTESLAGIVIAQTFVAAPFLIAVARAAFMEVDPALEDVTATLGLGPIARFTRVAVPAAGRGLRTGMVLSWLRAFGEYGATVILAYHPYSLPVFTYLQFSGAGLPNTEGATAIGLVVAAVAVALSYANPPRIRHRALPLPAPSRPAAPRDLPLAFDLDYRVGSFRLALAHRAEATRLAILGPSGSGKSLTLRCLAGVAGPGVGSVELGERPLHDGSHRRVGYVPQSLGLLPHLSAGRQVVFGRDPEPALAAYWVDQLHIGHLLDRMPDQLSGGERQRVGLARAFARDPEVLLLDEPFSALDAPVRDRLRLELRTLQRASGVASVVVTHDPEEAAILADEILVIADGRLLQAGTRREVFDRPASATVARLIGIPNVFEGQAAGGDRLLQDGIELVLPTNGTTPGAPLGWAIRAEAVRLGAGPLTGRVVDSIDRGTTTETLVELAPGFLVRARSTEQAPAIGEELRLELPREAIATFAGTGPATTALEAQDSVRS